MSVNASEHGFKLFRISRDAYIQPIQAEVQLAIYDCDFPWILGESPKVFSLPRYPWNVACHLFHYSIINFRFEFDSSGFFYICFYD